MSAALSTWFPEGELRLLLPWLSLPAWRATGCTCQIDFGIVHPVHLSLARSAFAPGVTMQSLGTNGPGFSPRAAALRIWKFTGSNIEDKSMPKVVDDMFRWAHYGHRGERPEGAGPKGKRKGKSSR